MKQKEMMEWYMYLFLVIVILIVLHLGGPLVNWVQGGNYTIVEGRGTISYHIEESRGPQIWYRMWLGGGGWSGLLDDDGNSYCLVNLPPEFQEDNLRVKFKGYIHGDKLAHPTWYCLELISIEIIDY